MKVVNQYIGEARGPGYLGDFSYRTHAEFYPEFCDLEIDLYTVEGTTAMTTRDRFITILLGANARDQAKILRGVLERFPIGVGGAPVSRTKKLRSWIGSVIARLEGASPVESHTPEDASAIVERAIADAETLLRTSGASSGVDRIHTALHGFLIDVCKSGRIECAPDASLATLLKAIRNEHFAFRDDTVRRSEITVILRTMGAIVDSLGPVRNKASAAHPNELLQEPEAMLAINAARTIIHYVDTRIRKYFEDTPF